MGKTAWTIITRHDDTVLEDVLGAVALFVMLVVGMNVPF